MTIKELIKAEPQGIIAKAYRFAEKAHAGQKRKTGEPYFNHVLGTAQTLLEWKLDDTSIAAGLLHDTVEDTSATLDEIKTQFGEEAAFLVDGVTKLGRIKYRGTTAKVESLRKMLLAVSEDLRVIFIKLADRLHNMKTLGALPPQKQKRIAMETDHIYAPIAERLGMQNLAGELHDLTFPYLFPREDRWLKGTIKDKFEIRHKYLEKIQPVLLKALRDQGIVPLAVDFRAKRMSSLYNKLERHGMDIEKIYDLVAMRIIVENVAECYNILGIIHQIWPPIPNRVKDYIALPKPNGYRSLHTTVIGPDDKIIEIQIRTRQMHEDNEHGIAAHWLYEQSKTSGKAAPSPRRMAEETQWVKQLRRWQENYESASTEEFLQSMKVDLFKDRIFAITPNGDVIDLPIGSTPVDFAYAIHSEVGNTCVGAKVNNETVPLSHELKSGDIVFILTQKGKKPSEEWLEFIKTPTAREHLRLALRRKDVLRGMSRLPTKAEIKIIVDDRLGLLKDITATLARSHVNILSFSAHDGKGGKFPVDKVGVATTDKQKLDKLVMKLKTIKGVREVSYSLI